MTEAPTTLGTGRVIAKNTMLNFAVQLVVIPLTIVAIPILVKKLGVDTFGILSIIWVFVGYFALLDFGMGKTVTRYVAEYIARGERDKAWRVAWVSMSASVFVGVVLMASVVLLSGFLSHRLFTGRAIDYIEVRNAIIIAALTLPFILAQGILRAQLMAIQRFDVANLVQAISGVAQWAGAIALVELGFGLIAILFCTLILRALSVGGLLFFAHQTSEGFLKEFTVIDFSVLRKLARYSSWIALIQLVSPVLAYADRFFLSSFVSTEKATFFIVPYEILSRFMIIPFGLTSTLFPALTERQTMSGKGESLHLLYHRSIKYIIIIILPLVVVCFLFAHDILKLWMGTEFAADSSTALRLLAFGFLMNAVAYVPSVALMAIGRPDMVAKLEVAELPLYLVYCFFVIPSFGVNGAAAGNALRMAIDMAVLLVLAHRELNIPSHHYDIVSISRLAVPTAILCIGAFLAAYLNFQFLYKAAGFLFFLIVYSLVVYFFTFDRTEKDFLGSSFSRILSIASGKVQNGD